MFASIVMLGRYSEETVLIFYGLSYLSADWSSNGAEFLAINTWFIQRKNLHFVSLSALLILFWLISSLNQKHSFYHDLQDLISIVIELLKFWSWILLFSIAPVKQSSSLYVRLRFLKAKTILLVTSLWNITRIHYHAIEVIKFTFQTNYGWSRRSVMAEVLGSLCSLSDWHSWEIYDPPLHPLSYGSNSITAVLLQGWLWH